MVPLAVTTARILVVLVVTGAQKARAVVAEPSLYLLPSLQDRRAHSIAVDSECRGRSADANTRARENLILASKLGESLSPPCQPTSCTRGCRDGRQRYTLHVAKCSCCPEALQATRRLKREGQKGGTLSPLAAGYGEEGAR